MAAASDMQVIKELRDTLDGKPVQQLEHDLPPDNASGITKIVSARDRAHVAAG